MLKQLNEKYITLEKNVFLKELEEPSLYKTTTDELFEVNKEAFDYLKKCDGSHNLLNHQPEGNFLDYCLDNKILSLLNEPIYRKISVGKNKQPSLRYLLLNITSRCNLKCKHCYLGESKPVDLPLSLILEILFQFADLGGLRLIFSGGEPLLHPDFWKINQILKNIPFRTILITNGTLINDKVASRLNFNEVQISVDGLKESHDILRGQDSFSKTMNGIKYLIQNNKPLSIATMVHNKNLDDFKGLEKIINEAGAISWTIDIPTEAGRLKDNSDLIPPLEKAIPLFEYQFGAEVHQSGGDYTCGAHLACIQSNGTLTKCGFYQDWTGGNIKEGLNQCWEKLKKIKYSDLNCNCEYIDKCRGGCRYRAEIASGRFGPDPVKCKSYNVEIDI